MCIKLAKLDLLTVYERLWTTFSVPIIVVVVDGLKVFSLDLGIYSNSPGKSPV